MRQIFLHIGAPKTGTTSLQAFLAENRAALAEQGFYFPDAFAPSRERGLRLRELERCFCEPGETGSGIPPEWRRILAGIEDSGAGKVVISHEGFFRPRGNDPRVIEGFKGFFPDARWRIIVYLRRQDDFVESLYKQLVRTSPERPAPAIEEFIAAETLDYLEALEPWEKAFGRDNLTVVPFEGFREPESLMLDFLKRIGASGEAGRYAFPERLDNPSLSTTAAQMIAAFSRLPLSRRNRKRMTKLIRRLVDGRKTTKKSGRRRLLSLERRRLLAEHEESNRRVAERYLDSRRQTLFEKAA